MKLISMKREADDGMAYDYTPSAYPSGLCIYLDDDQCAALGITKALKAGTKVTLSGSAIVTSATESLDSDTDEKGNEVRLSLQITDLGVSVQGVVRDAAAQLYGKG